MMTLLTVALTLTATYIVTLVATTITYESLPMDKTPDWLDDLYRKMWRQ